MIAFETSDGLTVGASAVATVNLLKVVTTQVLAGRASSHVPASWVHSVCSVQTDRQTPDV